MNNHSLHIRQDTYEKQNGPLQQIQIDEVLGKDEFRDPEKKLWKLVRGSTGPSLRKNNFIHGRFKMWSPAENRFVPYEKRDVASHEMRYLETDDGSLWAEIGSEHVLYIQHHTKDIMNATVNLPPDAKKVG